MKCTRGPLDVLDKKLRILLLIRDYPIIEHFVSLEFSPKAVLMKAQLCGDELTRHVAHFSPYFGKTPPCTDPPLDWN